MTKLLVLFTFAMVILSLAMQANYAKELRNANQKNQTTISK